MWIANIAVAAILALWPNSASELKNKAENEFIVFNVVGKMVLYIFIGKKVSVAIGDHFKKVKN